GAITPVKHSEWPAPVVPILKPDITIRLCGDYKLTVNRVLPCGEIPHAKSGRLICGLIWEPAVLKAEQLTILDAVLEPLTIMSRTLAPSEKRYSQLDREGLAVVFGIQGFHEYVYGHISTICTDHKP
ncbi:hypothetical protein P4O66_012692, partial [Electrophorus voltai]